MREDILINFTPQETRVAVMYLGAVQELHIERTASRGLVGNIYLGRVVRILLSGTLCKKPVLRRTPLGRSICDVILAVNRHYGRADYLPCIAWGQTAVQIAGMDVGERLALEGRVQSRTYTKLLESGSEERTAFEVSIMQLLDEEETEETALL